MKSTILYQNITFIGYSHFTGKTFGIKLIINLDIIISETEDELNFRFNDIYYALKYMGSKYKCILQKLESLSDLIFQVRAR